MITDWLMIVITAVYVIATIFICIANFKSAKATREQVSEARRQYEEEHCAFISYELIYEHRILYGLRFTNHGKRVAANVQLQLDKDFIDSLMDQSIKDQLYSLDGKEFTLGIEQSYDIYFGGDAFRKRLNKVPIQGEISYNDRCGEYTDSFYIDFNKYAPIYTVTTDWERAEESAKNLIKNLAEIVKELEKINQNLKRESVENASDVKEV